MKKKIAWITDSTVYIPEELKNHPDIYIVPLSITFERGTYEDGINLTPELLYKNIREDKEIPKTSQPSPGRGPFQSHNLFGLLHRQICRID